jgi:hypothetical protein
MGEGIHEAILLVNKLPRLEEITINAEDFAVLESR